MTVSLNAALQTSCGAVVDICPVANEACLTMRPLSAVNQGDQHAAGTDQFRWVATISV